VDVKRPNFFIVGASRCGTTSMYWYLRDHPNVFMPVKKETRFFGEDQPHPARTPTLEQYLRLFAGATDRHLAIGEASGTYMYSYVAVGRIRAFNPDARLIVMVRNPIDMVYSLHGQLCYNGHEDEEDFERAWRLQPLRKGWMSVPPGCLCPRFLEYEDFGKLGAQVERVLEIFPREQVKIVVYDDLAQSTAAVYEEVLAFLGLPSDGRTEFPRMNESRKQRSKVVGKMAIRASHWSAVFAPVRLARRVARGLGLKGAVVKSHARPPLSPAFREELADVFRDDVRKLSDILGRDLTHWTARMEAPPCASEPAAISR
jgi:hypothetical protein